MNRPITDRTRSRFFEIAAIVILLSSIFLFGAVQPVVLLSEEFLILLLFMLYMINGLIRGKILDKTPLFLPFMFLLGSMVIQLIPLPFSVVRFISPSTIALREALGAGNGASALSLIPMKTFTQLLRWTTVFLFYLFIVNVFTRKTLPKLLNALFALTCFEVFYGLFLLFTGSNCLLWYCKPEYGSFGNRLHGTYRNPDHMAGYLEMLIPLHMAQVISKKLPTPFQSEEQAQKVLGIFIVMIFVIALFLTISRAGIIAFLVGMVYFYFSGKKETEGQGYTFYLKILTALVFIYLLWIGIGPIVDRFWNAASSLKNDRGVVWSDTLELVRNFPVFGTGFGTFRFVFPKYKTLLGQAIWRSPHNDYLMFFAEGGIISLLSFLWLIFSALKILVKENTLLARGAAAGFISILVHSFFDFNLQIPANAYLFAVIMAVGWISARENHGRHSLSHASGS
jgi:O-antigen ligase